ncbi:MAG: hypothetical protein HYV63_17375 [Candidatus Schekmanbacteria bacterium]|nr:hypothetical protein [Candidatus Schekmanbacteria bacterium]
MATVLLMRFNHDQGAALADESTWHMSFKYGYRRSNLGDAIFSLLAGDAGEGAGVTALYAGVGFPSFHREVADRSVGLLAGPPPAAGEPPRSVRNLSALVFSQYQHVHRRMVDDRLRFLWGFGLDGLNSLTLNRGGVSDTIAQEAIIAEAKKIAANSEHSDPQLRIFSNNGAVLGHSAREGLQAYSMSGEQCALDLTSAVTVLGDGDQVATHAFGRFAHAMNLQQRRDGWELADGLLVLLQVATETTEFQVRMGGYYQLGIVDGATSRPGARLRRHDGHRLKLASEVARAVSWKQLERAAGVELVGGLLLGDEDFDDCERRMFAGARDAAALRHRLHGFKPSWSPTATCTE